MIECKKLETLKEIEDNYNFFFIDLWGVVHNGVELFESVRSFLMRLKEKKKIIIFITNAPRRAFVISQQLQQFGLSKNNYDYIVSSGEITWINLKKNYEKKKCFLIGPPRDYHLVEGLNVEIVENLAMGVDLIINTGPWGDNDKLENYTKLLNDLFKFNAPMICSNPDKKVIRGKNFMICAGLLAEYYEKIGGEVKYFGKPHNNIYEFSFKLINERKKILVIGDSLDNDIKGANLQNLDSVLITEGIHREVNNNNDIDKQKLDDLIKKKKIFPTFCMKNLN
jgi:HAD superfamily hydrolase (TIGR01459 family)|tara:strand:- start:3137 stop:3979 length:843 start_codon:yes stop_codon:yes gene_type:complete